MNPNTIFLNNWSNLLCRMLSYYSTAQNTFILPEEVRSEARLLLETGEKEDGIWLLILSDGLSLLPWERFCLICAFLYDYDTAAAQAFQSCLDKQKIWKVPCFSMIMDLYAACFGEPDRMLVLSRTLLSRLFIYHNTGTDFDIKLYPALFQLLCGNVPYNGGCQHQIYTDIPQQITDMDISAELLRLNSRAHTSLPLILQLSGGTGCGKFYQMKLLSNRTGLPLLSLELDNLPSAAEKLDRLLEELTLELLMVPSLVCLLHYQDLHEHRQVLLRLYKSTCFLAVTTRHETVLPEIGTGMDVLQIHIIMHRKTRMQQQDLWQHYFSSLGITSPDELKDICNQYSFSIGEIEYFSHSYANRLEYGYDNTEFSLRSLIRERTAKQVSGGLARVISPRFSWDDLVLPDTLTESLHRICDRIYYQDKVFEAWDFGSKHPYGTSLSILFCGPPGTGKTMSAHVMANEMQTDLLYVDLSNMMNKYIGETEKNIQLLFDQAANIHAILFFDEADALFAKRSAITDSKDRYANTQTAYLLQCIEEYDGIVILATNLLTNFDTAFKRRMRHILYFNMPDEAGRLRLWESVFPEKAPLSDTVDLQLLAQKELSPAGIKNIALTAAYLAAKQDEITMEHLNEALKIEMMKDGPVTFGAEGF